MKNLTARYTGHSSSLTVTARTGKKGIIVQVRVKSPDAKSKIGCRNVFVLAHEAEAVSKFNELRDGAAKQGWTEKVKEVRNVNAFSVIPTPAEVEKPATTPKAKK